MEMDPPIRKKRVTSAKDRKPSSALRSLNSSQVPTQDSTEKEKTTITSSSSILRKEQVPEQIKSLCDLFHSLAGAYSLSCKFKSDQAIKKYESLPSEQFNSPWVLSEIARIYYEKSDYKTAADLFKRLEMEYPYRLQNMDHYSSLLWHMRKTNELAFLSKKYNAIDRLSPVTWCIAGNAMSCNREHESAISCFKRCISLDPEYGLAYVLCGLEYVLLEDFENSLKYLEKAVVVDPGNYKAWYGLGDVCYRTEKFGLCEVYLKKALELHPTNVVLLNQLARLMQRQSKYTEALDYLDITPLPPTLIHRRASIYFDMGEYENCVLFLENFLQKTPVIESHIFYLLGKAYLEMGESGKAIKAFIGCGKDFDSKIRNLLGNLSS